MSSFDEVQQILKMLKLENLSVLVMQVDGALRGGATGSEIWGGVRFYLLKALPNPMSVSLKARIEHTD